jgi:hypothetical protein
MESDAVHTVGDSTVVDMWVNGKFRNVSVSRDVIAAFLRLSSDRAAAMSDVECREFVRSHLRLVAAAAADGLRDMHPTADSVTIDAELLCRLGGKPVIERRQAAGR